MTIRSFSKNETGKLADLGVWYCESCESFHIKAGNLLLTFDRQEFSEFAHSVCDCYSANAQLRDLVQNI